MSVFWVNMTWVDFFSTHKAVFSSFVYPATLELYVLESGWTSLSAIKLNAGFSARLWAKML